MRCPYSKKCGGCQLQNLDYAGQLKYKQVKLIKLLGKYCHVEEIIGMKDPYHYRNKVQRAYARRNGGIVGGVYQSSTGNVVEVKDCMIEDEAAIGISATIAKLLDSFKIKAYDPESGAGFVRHTLIRRSFSTGQIMVVIVTKSGEFRSCRSFVNALLEKHPEITTVVRNINDGKIRLSMGRVNQTLYGDGYIEDRLMGLSFRISPNAFYQVNPIQTEQLYAKAKEYASLSGDETVIDAYCGTGTIGLAVSDLAQKVIGVELNEHAVKDAKANAKINGIKNVEFYSAEAGRFMVDLARQNKKIDVVITDPPRAGCSRDFLRSIVTLAPKSVVYVSCNPETLARDLGYLTHNGYKAKAIQGVDMFPYTDHVETVVRLERK